jgi:large subunit ribosomal protein L21e
VVRNRVEKKRVNVRIEHIRPSKCRADFLDRVQRVDEKLREAKKAGKKLHISEIKRFPTAPKAGFEVSSKGAVVSTLQPVKFDDML